MAKFIIEDTPNNNQDGSANTEKKKSVKQQEFEDLTKLYESGELFKSVDSAKTAVMPDILWGNWLVKNTITLQSGSGGVSKTSWNYSMISSLLHEGEFLGIKGRSIKSLYFDLESKEQLIKSRLNLIGRLQQEHPYFFYCNMTMSLDNMEFFTEKFIKDKWRPDVVFIDPLSMMLNSRDENDNMEATKKMKQLRKFVERNELALVLVHHSGKADVWGVGNSRGASAYGNLSDVTWTYHPLGKGFADDKFALHIPKNRFVNDGFLQCIQKVEGTFVPCEFPDGFNKNSLTSTGIKTFKVQEAIELLMSDGKQRSSKEIMEEMDVTDETQRNAVYRAITPLLQKEVLTRVAHGIYQNIHAFKEIQDRELAEEAARIEAGIVSELIENAVENAIENSTEQQPSSN